MDLVRLTISIWQFFEHGLASQRRELANKLFSHVLTLSLQMYGCRVIQKVLTALCIVISMNDCAWSSEYVICLCFFNKYFIYLFRP